MNNRKIYFWIIIVLLVGIVVLMEFNFPEAVKTDRYNLIHSPLECAKAALYDVAFGFLLFFLPKTINPEKNMEKKIIRIIAALNFFGGAVMILIALFIYFRMV